MARITVEDCIDKFPSRFELVLVASQRARNLHSGDATLIDKDNDKNTVIALREIAEESISVNEMKENLIEEFQTVTISDEEDENLELETFTNNLKDDESIDQNSPDTKNSDIEDKDIKEANAEANEIEEEIKELNLAEDSELQSEYEITDDLEQSEDILSSDNDENSNIS